MAKNATIDKSNGYDEIASAFIAQRNSSIGGSTVRHWSRTLPRGSSVLDLGCGHGVPISQVLIEEGLAVYAIDASPRIIAAFQQRFPLAHAECAALEGSTFFDRSFDGVVAWGLLFLLPPGIQATVIGKVAKALNPFGKFLFTAPQEAVTWEDSLTGRKSVSLGSAEYQRILQSHGLALDSGQRDEGDNHYYFAWKP